MKPIPSHELVGARVAGELPSAALVDLWGRISSGIVKYGFVIEYRDLEPPRTGIFDGLRITIDPDVSFEMQCFLLLHLFGHSVQWVAPSLAQTVDAIQHSRDRSDFLNALRDYEFEAARFGMQLMHERGITGLDQWYSDFVETDWRYVERFYGTDRLASWAECVVSGCRLIEPAPIPPLEHRLVDVRFAF